MSLERFDNSCPCLLSSYGPLQRCCTDLQAKTIILNTDPVKHHEQNHTHLIHVLQSGLMNGILFCRACSLGSSVLLSIGSSVDKMQCVSDSDIWYHQDCPTQEYVGHAIYMVLMFITAHISRWYFETKNYRDVRSSE